MRYSITCNSHLFRVTDTWNEAKIAVFDAAIHACKGKTFILERGAHAVDEDTHTIIGAWHVFANDGYHLIDVVRLL